MTSLELYELYWRPAFSSLPSVSRITALLPLGISAAFFTDARAVSYSRVAAFGYAARDLTVSITAA